MSYILDALKKSQRQRDLGGVPSLSAVHGSGAAAVASGRLAWGLVLGGLAGALAAGGAALVVMHPWSADGVPPVAASAPAGAVPAAAGLASAERVVAPTPAVTTPEPQPAPRLITPTSRLPESSAALARPAPPPLPAVAAAAPPSLPAASAQWVPAWEELPDAVRAAVPPLRLNVHVYAESSAARFVFINNALYHEGQTTREGALVEEINPEGAVLSYGGTRFRIHL